MSKESPSHIWRLHQESLNPGAPGGAFEKIAQHQAQYEKPQKDKKPIELPLIQEPIVSS